MIYIQLFLSFLQVGALSFGGGYAAMPLIQEQVVMYSSILYYCNLVGICLYEVSEYVLTSGNTGISQTGSCIDDRQSRGNDFNFCIFY